MAYLRILLALLISLALPAQTLADVIATTACCPMTEAAASVESAAATHDCCHDEDPQGKRCTSDLSCKCGSHPAIGTRAFVPPLPDLFQTHATAPIWPQSVTPATLWRPPTPPSPLS
jgi:hypothetical protein